MNDARIERVQRYLHPWPGREFQIAPAVPADQLNAGSTLMATMRLAECRRPRTLRQFRLRPMAESTSYGPRCVPVGIAVGSRQWEVGREYHSQAGIKDIQRRAKS